jgi:Bacterial mobilisation protein (MobC)
VLTRAHLRGLAPLPKAEWLALEKSVSELSRLGRNINQIARAANRGERVTAPGRDDFLAILRVCEALRDHFKGLLQANLKSWQQGYVDQND